MRSLVFASLAAGVLVVGCAPKSGSGRRQPLPRSAGRGCAVDRAGTVDASAADAAGIAASRCTGAHEPQRQPHSRDATGRRVLGRRTRTRRQRRATRHRLPLRRLRVMPAPVTPIVSATAPSPDPRVGLAPGRWDAAQAAWNIRLVSTTPPCGEVPRRHELRSRVHRQVRRSRATTTGSRSSTSPTP